MVFVKNLIKLYQETHLYDTHFNIPFYFVQLLHRSYIKNEMTNIFFCLKILETIEYNVQTARQDALLVWSAGHSMSLSRISHTVGKQKSYRKNTPSFQMLGKETQFESHYILNQPYRALICNISSFS